MEAVVERRETLIDRGHQVEVFDNESIADLCRPDVQERHKPGKDFQRVIRRRFFAPRLSDRAVPHVSRFLRREVLLEPGLSNHEHPVGMRLRPPQQAIEVKLEVIEHRRRIRHVGANLFRAGAHGAGAPDPCAGTQMDLDRPEPAIPRAPQQFSGGQRPRPPAERTFRMRLEHVECAHRPEHPRTSLLQPVHHIADPDQHDDELQAWIARKNALEDEIELRGSHPGFADVAHMHS